MIKQQFINFYKNEESEIFRLLTDLVETNSYSFNEKGIKKCLNIFSKKANFLSYKFLENNCLLLENSSSGKDYILLMGHMDTVFPEDSKFQKILFEGDVVKGPGTYDMKGGLVVALYALKFLHFIGELNNLNIKFLINSDEEIGSLKSKTLIEKYAKGANCAIVFEGAGENGEVVTGRKGKIGLKAFSKGEAGHAAFIIKGKKSAILDIAHRIIDFENLNDIKKRISCNVGKVAGGIGANTVPDYAEIMIDIRYSCKEDGDYLAKKILDIANKSYIKGVKFEMIKTSERPCMDENDNMKFFNKLKEQFSNYGINLKNEFRNGVSDANFISACGVPVLDGFGPLGGNDHSDKEFIIKDSVSERIFLTAVALKSS
ncbi:carboxypeptidase G2 [Deferribacter desulfuricans SSM1]|uniref:Carboxypeptidase G2 n=1 Tax=Deferribacter desulfuricans (strain DSM 14783 / JCM 11476 / NBRC 101012 / SSM1) TaxID=639282 RepID=D3P9B4_DEFDS|nr:M20/M25/M40 family metallo-hydrolase [Deferribacter desulfuricans]BAI81304.1 carboxypeptidase G2 [Deferribacter desulfuricans SSM1]